MTINSWYSHVPVEIAKGGTNAGAMATVNGIIKYDGTRLVTSPTVLVDANNFTTNTSQPAFNYQADATQVNVLGSGANYTVLFPNRIFDQTLSFDGTVFTAPKTGLYCLGSTLAINAAFLVGNNAMDFGLVVAGALFRLNTFNPFNCASAGLFYKNSSSLLINMNLGDTAYVSVFATGAANTISIEAGACCIWGYLVC